jgi:sigma-B regulation protein RsbU (phosphoserine phosphatase)
MPAMRPPPFPLDEPQRLADLAQLEILYTPPESAFDRITSELARIFDAPLASIAFIDREQQSYKSLLAPEAVLPYMATQGADSLVEPRDVSICAHVVGNNRELFIEDLSQDPEFADHPAVTQLGFRFYAGAPLRSDSGRALGSLCIMDVRPRRLTDTERGLIKLLAETVMSEAKLRAATLRLARRNALIEQDLSHARTLQQFLLPPESITCAAADGKSGFCISRLYHPHDHLGGDFIDVLLRSDHSAVILVADVTGHGAGAALTAAMTKSVFARHAAKVSSPEQLLTALNADLFHASPDDQFVTAVAAILDPHCCQLRLSSAGHPRPILLREHDRGATMLKIASDIPLLIESYLLNEKHTTISLSPLERVLIFTDGASEACNPQGVPLEDEGLCRLVAKCPSKTGPAFLRCVLGAITEYAREGLKDDVALMLLEPITGN